MKITLKISIFIVGVFALLAGCREASKIIRLKLAHGLNQSHPVHQAMVFMAERVAKKSGGRLRLDIYPSEQLGSERECLELLQIGSLAMTKVSASVLEGFAPEYQVLSLPYIFRNDAHRFAALASPIGQKLLLASEKYWLRGLCFYDAGSRSFYTTRKPV